MAAAPPSEHQAGTSEARPPTRRLLAIAALACFWVLLFGLYIYEASWLPPWPASTPEEDAFISFRFADNLAEGYGPVFNRGGRAVEGYTNFLWVAWLAALHRQWPDTVLHALWSGFALGFLVLPAAWLLARRVAGRWAWGVPVVLALSRYHTENALTGLETVAYNLLFLVALLLFADVLEGAPGRRRQHATAATSVLLVLLAMTRFEGVYLFPLLSLFWGWRRWRDGESPLRDWGWYAPFLALYGAYTGWRVLTFGELLPNTYYAKLLVTGTGVAKLASGLAHVGDFLLAYPALPLLVIAFALALPPRRWRPFHTVLVAAITTQLGLVAFIGGDWSYLAPYWRLLSTVAPLFLVLGAACLQQLLSERRRWAALLLLGTCLLLSAFRVGTLAPAPAGGHPQAPARPSLQAALSRLALLPRELGPRLGRLLAFADTNPERKVGLRLGEQLGPAGRVVGQHAGRIPYYSRLEFVDIIGYTDRQTNRLLWDPARGSFDPARWPLVWEHLLGLSPDLLLILPKADSPAAFAPLAAALDAHGYCLANALRSPSARLGFLTFEPCSSVPPPAQGCTDTVDLGGRPYPLCPQQVVDLDALATAPRDRDP